MNPRPFPSSRSILAAALLAVLAACDSPSGAIIRNPQVDPTLQSVLVTPDGRTLQSGATLQFQAAGVMSDGDTTAVGVTWTATGGAITSGGLFTAGATAGTFRVVGTAQGGLADTATVTVTVPSANPTLVAVVVTPPTASVAAGGTVQFAATGQLSNGAAQAVNVTWTATGGTVSGGGLYTAGASAGSHRVIATGPGGLADTAAVTITAAGAPAAYTRIAGDDWRYTSKDQLRAADLFWWFRSGDVYPYVDLVPDATFGQVARITFPQSSEGDWAPKLSADFTPRDKVWYRWRMKFSPGWTTVGTLPAGYANSYKIAFQLWEGYEGRAEVEYSNTNEYMPFWNVKQVNGGFVQYAERILPGSAADFGRTGSEWTDGEYYEFVMYYEKTGATSARQHWWRRRLTNNGAIVNTYPWMYLGREYTGAPTPRVRGITLGGNKNRNNTSTMYIYWGPWEVVDGSQHPNPWNMPNLQ